MKVTKSTTPSGKCSKDTLRRRTNEIAKVREVISGGDTAQQMRNEMKRIPKEERTELMQEAGFHVHIPAEEGLAMKADLCLPWNKMRVMRRYIRTSLHACTRVA